MFALNVIIPLAISCFEALQLRPSVQLFFIPVDSLKNVTEGSHEK
jgi:hypothetical protein